ncbi:MAG: hypothetical protein P4L65_03260 [Legionella sp.]|nr:hypothetical protein [Legionella sp.]
MPPKFKSDETAKSIPQKVVGWLFREHNLSLRFTEWLRLLSATLIVRNRQLSQDFFNALSKKITSSFADPKLNDLKKDLILYNALSYIAFAAPQEGQVISIKGIDYSIQKIALTSGWVSSTYYAYGLKAITDTNAQSILIFQGTTTPADHGFLAGLLADTRPVGAVGTQLYARGQEQIQNWINREHQRTQKRILCTGQSLGGAMSLHAHIHQPDAVDFFIVNPPTLTNREKEIYEKNRAQLSDDNTRTLTVVSHINDPVLNLGSLYLPEGTKMYRHGENNENRIIAHAKAPDCSQDAQELHFETHDNSKRATSYAWKIIKTFLSVAVLILHVIALPIRITIKIVELATQSSLSDKSGTQNNVQSSGESSEADDMNRPKPGTQYTAADELLATPPENGAPSLQFFPPSVPSMPKLANERASHPQP